MVNMDRVNEYSQLESEDDWRKPTENKEFMNKVNYWKKYNFMKSNF